MDANSTSNDDDDAMVEDEEIGGGKRRRPATEVQPAPVLGGDGGWGNVKRGRRDR